MRYECSRRKDERAAATLQTVHVNLSEALAAPVARYARHDHRAAGAIFLHVLRIANAHRIRTRRRISAIDANAAWRATRIISAALRGHFMRMRGIGSMRRHRYVFRARQIVGCHTRRRIQRKREQNGNSAHRRLNRPRHKMILPRLTFTTNSPIATHASTLA